MQAVTACYSALPSSSICGPDVKIKAAGGIKDFSDAELMLSLGADRLGTSRLVKAMKEKEQKMPLSSFVK